MKRTIPALLALTLVAGCATDQYGNQTYAPAVGALGGAGLAGLACSVLGAGTGQVAIVGACSALGALGGAALGQNYANSTAERAALAEQRAMTTRVGTPVPWRDEATNSQGVVTTIRDGQDFSTGAYCREFQHKAKIAGKLQQTYGKACQQPDGTWEIVG